MKAIIFLGIILYGLKAKKEKKFWLVCIAFYITMVLTSKDQADFINYEKYYNLLNSGIVEIQYMGMPVLWGKLCLLFGKINLTYVGMSVIVIVISMSLIHVRIKKMKIYENLFWIFYLIFPGLVQCVQLRFFLGTSIVFWGLIPFLEKKPKSTITFCISIIIAYFVHSSCLIFMIFLFLPVFDKCKNKKTLLFALTSCIIIYLGNKYFIKIIGNLIPTTKFERYFVSDISKTTITWFVKIIFVWIFAYIESKYFYLKIINSDIDNENKFFFTRCLNAITLLLTTTIFLIYDSNFHRFLEIGYMLFYIIFAYYFSNFKIQSKVKLFIIFLNIICLCFVTYNFTPIDTVIKPFFTYSGINQIFN